MQFNVVDTYAAYMRLLEEPDAHRREQIFRDELVEPFAGLTRVFGSTDPLATFAQWNMRLDAFTPENRDAMRARLDALRDADAFARAVKSLDRGWQAFANYHDRIKHDSITFGLYLCDMSAMPMAGGYTGFGGIPRWIMTVYDTPTPENLKRVEACTVHELHHNLAAGSDNAVKINIMNVTVAEYMLMEGLAESFAAELYGEDTIGPWVTDFDESRLPETRALFKDALNVSGFNEVRRYIFGDPVMAAYSGEAGKGIPMYAGYALGYRVVQAYLKRTGKSVVETTYTPVAEIIEESRFFA